jgi:acyl carrier protein
MPDRNHPTARTNIAQKIAEIWQDVLQCEQISPSDDFFGVGGSSLSAVKFLSMMENCFGIEALSPEDLYRAPTFEAIVSKVETRVRS